MIIIACWWLLRAFKKYFEYMHLKHFVLLSDSYLFLVAKLYLHCFSRLTTFNIELKIYLIYGNIHNLCQKVFVCSDEPLPKNNLNYTD